MENDISFLTFLSVDENISTSVQYNNIIVFEIISNYTSWYAATLYLKICSVDFIYTNYIWSLLYWFLVLRKSSWFYIHIQICIVPIIHRRRKTYSCMCKHFCWKSWCTRSSSFDQPITIKGTCSIRLDFLYDISYRWYLMYIRDPNTIMWDEFDKFEKINTVPFDINWDTC